jgi:hypothetical protein
MSGVPEGGWIGLITRQSIIDQLVHVASVQGSKKHDMQRANDVEWLDLAADAFAIYNDDIRRAVIEAMPS